MNSGALVYCLLDADGEYTPEGYELLDTAHVGDYELKLWRGTGHINGAPLQFNEVSLNAAGRSFDPASQKQHGGGSIHGLGRRGELLRTVAHWINKFGDLYIGSHVPSKLSVYHKLFKRYLPQLRVGDPYAAFDECEGVAEYFHVSGDGAVVECILRDASATEVETYLKRLPSVEEQALAKAIKLFDKVKVREEFSRPVDESHFGDIAEVVATRVVYECGYATGNEVVDIDFYNKVMRGLLVHACRH
jgi:hypothetical protein